MTLRIAALLFSTMALVACEPGTVPSSNPPPVASQQISQPPVEPKGNTRRSIAQQTAGNPNYDRNGKYIGKEGVATVVEIPDDDNDLPIITVPNVPEVTLPRVEAPDLSTMNCTGATTENAGTLDCTN